MKNIRKLPTGYTITVTVDSGTCHIQQVEDDSVGALVTSSKTFGPYLVERNFLIDDGDNVTVTISPVTSESTSLLTSGSGAPDNAAQAALTVNPAGNDNGLTFTAKEYGASGNSISVAYVDPAANDAALSVSVFNSAISVSLATDSGGLITSTAAQVKAAIDASVPAAKLVTVAIYTADSGTADDGSGVVTAMAESSLSGGSGTGIGTSLPGCLYIDTDNAFVYRNSGTQAVPAWTKLGDAA